MKSLISNKKLRSKWYEDNKDNLNKALNPQLKFIVMVFYHAREISKISHKLEIFNLTYPVINKYFQLLKDIGFLRSEKKGRITTWTITQRGDMFCIEMLNEARK